MANSFHNEHPSAMPQDVGCPQPTPMTNPRVTTNYTASQDGTAHANQGRISQVATKQETHTFESSGEAYDATQCSSNIKQGDILVIQSKFTGEKVVGLAHTWPVAVTKESGNLHSTVNGLESLTQPDPSSKDPSLSKPMFTMEQVNGALAVARKLGWPTADL